MRDQTGSVRHLPDFIVETDFSLRGASVGPSSGLLVGGTLLRRIPVFPVRPSHTGGAKSLRMGLSTWLLDFS
jgi:hypothetical protein